MKDPSIKLSITDKQARNYAASIPYDRQLYRQEIRGQEIRGNQGTPY